MQIKIRGLPPEIASDVGWRLVLETVVKSTIQEQFHADENVQVVFVERPLISERKITIEIFGPNEYEMTVVSLVPPAIMSAHEGFKLPLQYEWKYVPH